MQRQRGNATWRAKVVQYLHSASKAYERRNPSLQPKYCFDTSLPNRLLEQTRTSILSWKPGPRRGRLGAIEEHIAGKWHTIALQAIEYLRHEFFMNHFYITTWPAAPSYLRKTLFTRTSGINSAFIHDTQNGQQQVVKEGLSGWFLQAGPSHTSFREIPRNGKSYFTMMSFHTKKPLCQETLNRENICFLQSVL